MKLVPIVLLLFSCKSSLIPHEKINLDNFIIWNDSPCLGYSDFEAKIQPLQVTKILTVATCSSYLYIEPKINFKYLWRGRVHELTILSLFDKKRSWFNLDYKEAYILRHEQLHFDLTELVARRLRKSLSVRPKAIPIDSLKIEFQQSIIKLESIQNKYDTETDHGTQKIKQSEWEQSVKIELSELSKFKNALIKVSGDKNSREMNVKKGQN